MSDRITLKAGAHNDPSKGGCAAVAQIIGSGFRVAWPVSA